MEARISANLRDDAILAHILVSLGFSSVRLLTKLGNEHLKLRDFGIKISECSHFQELNREEEILKLGSSSLNGSSTAQLTDIRK